MDWIKIPKAEYEQMKTVSDDGFFVIAGIEIEDYRYIPAHILQNELYQFAHEELSGYPIVFMELLDEEII